MSCLRDAPPPLLAIPLLEDAFFLAPLAFDDKFEATDLIERFEAAEDTEDTDEAGEVVEGRARCNFDVLSLSELHPGNIGTALRSSGSSKEESKEDEEPERGRKALVLTLACAKYGIVEIRGDSAHGLLFEAKSCSRVPSMYLIVILLAQLYNKHSPPQLE